jgi:hypothetical protein
MEMGRASRDRLAAADPAAQGIVRIAHGTTICPKSSLDSNTREADWDGMS